MGGSATIGLDYSYGLRRRFGGRMDCQIWDTGRDNHRQRSPIHFSGVGDPLQAAGNPTCGHNSVSPPVEWHNRMFPPATEGFPEGQVSDNGLAFTFALGNVGPPGRAKGGPECVISGATLWRPIGSTR